MLLTNKEIHLTFGEAVSIIRELEFLILSLHKMGAFYADEDRREYADETTRFIDEEGITKRLASIRKLLASKFDLSIGEDDMDDLEREMIGLQVWSPRTSRD